MSKRSDRDLVIDSLLAGADCPAPEVFLQASRSELGEQEQQALARHIAECPTCAAEYDLAAVFDAGESARSSHREDIAGVVAHLQANSPVAPRKMTSPRLVAGGGLALAALLIAGSVVLFQFGGPGAPPTLPERGGESNLRGELLTLTAPRGELSEFPKALEWEGLERATGYRVRLITPDGAVLQEKLVPESPLLLEELDQGILRRATVYTWEVAALDDAGEERAVSGPARFTVMPR